MPLMTFAAASINIPTGLAAVASLLVIIAALVSLRGVLKGTFYKDELKRKDQTIDSWREAHEALVEIKRVADLECEQRRLTVAHLTEVNAHLKEENDSFRSVLTGVEFLEDLTRIVSESLIRVIADHDRVIEVLTAEIRSAKP